MRGLLGRRSLAPGTGLLLRPAFSIHTAFMRFPIDVVFVDHDQTVIRIAPSLKPFKTASCRGSREVIELSAGECGRRGLQVGDRVAWASRRTGDEGLGAERTPTPHATKHSVIVASTDQRFQKLARFLLDGRDIDVETSSPRSDDLRELLASTTADAVLLDAADRLGDALRLSNALRASRPDVPIVLVGEGGGAGALEGVALYDKWEQLDEAIDAIDLALSKSHP